VGQLYLLGTWVHDVEGDAMSADAGRDPESAKAWLAEGA
jgi:hypothetical protein